MKSQTDWTVIPDPLIQVRGGEVAFQLPPWAVRGTSTTQADGRHADLQQTKFFSI